MISAHKFCMMEAKGYFLSKEEKFEKDLLRQIEVYGGIIPENVLYDLLNKHNMSMEEFNDFLHSHNAKVTLNF